MKSARCDLLISLILGSAMLLIPLLNFLELGDAYITSKWLIFYIVAILAAIVTVVHRAEFTLPRFKIFSPVLLASLAYLISFLLHFPGPFENHFLDFLCFILVYFSSAQLTHPRRILEPLLFWSALTSALILSGLALFGHFGGALQLLASRCHLAVGFGHPNMLAEFLVLALILVLTLNPLGATKFHRGRFVLIALCSTVILSALIQTGCRSAELGAAVCVGIWFLSKLPLRRRLLGLGVGSAVLFFSGLLLLSLIAGGRIPTSDSAKGHDIFLRAARWANSIAATRDFPLRGAGPGRFEFGYIPYRNLVLPDDETTENMVPRSPHNGYVEAVFELGWPIGLGLICFGFVIFIHAFSEDHRKPLPLAFLLTLTFIATDALAAFPMELAMPFFLLALLMGLDHGREYSVSGKSTNRAIRAALLATVAGASYFTFFFADSYHLNAQNPAAIELSHAENTCLRFTANWKTCLLAAFVAEQGHRPEVAEKILDHVLKGSPDNFVALRERALLQFSIGKIPQACASQVNYSHLLPESLALREYISVCR